jgi:hypothetical protein
LTRQRIDLRVIGQVVGVADRPLELYLLLDRCVVGYQVVTAKPEGQPFEFGVPDLPEADWQGPEGGLLAFPVQVDLVNGAVVWYTSIEEVSVERVFNPGK